MRGSARELQCDTIGVSIAGEQQVPPLGLKPSVGMTNHKLEQVIEDLFDKLRASSERPLNAFMKHIAILGSTGSIGKSTLSIVESFPDRFSVVSMAAGNNVDLAFEQARRWRPQLLSMATAEAAIQLQDKLKKAGLNNAVEVTHGSAGTVKVSTHPDADFVVSAIVGVAGLEATYEAVKAGKSIGLANKECMVAAGDLITAEARKHGKPLLPIDSEHNAIHQCMRGGRRNEVQRVWLTASGGPFFHTPASDFSKITVEQALNHPTWKMGQAHYHRFGDPDE